MSFTTASSVGNQTPRNLPKSGCVNQFDFLSRENRIKPPPIRIDPERKVVKLGGGGHKLIQSKKPETSEKIQKITFSSSSATAPKTNSKVEKTVPTSKSSLEHVVINSFVKKKTPTKINSTSSETPTAPTKTIANTNAGTVDTKPAANKIKLNRRNNIHIPSAEENPALENMENDNIKTGNATHQSEKRDMANSVNSKWEKPQNTSGMSIFARSKQRQINAINETLQTRAIQDLEPHSKASKVCNLIT